MPRRICRQCGHYHKQTCPSPKQIEALTAKIRAKWTRKDHIDRTLRRDPNRKYNAEMPYQPQVINTYGVILPSTDEI